MKLFLDAGADTTISPGLTSPLRIALRNNNAVAGILRHAIIESNRAGVLHKARCLLGAEAAPACLQGRMEWEEALPWGELTPQHQQPQLQLLQQQGNETQGDGGICGGNIGQGEGHRALRGATWSFWGTCCRHGRKRKRS